ncbi:ankyrin repeat domain-containing protein 54-like isoform X2 [Mercenaria mercenaria]|uniref:ankyrin repeat domain-containing protein 54-like isoform X2 n=1 Tax=Mercenaria mercenaria TaxID=6596 RepID=UPI00234F05AA|nr:ankyrin repeat domain-containing protein 54-like isoform X2 [Mercenaria mercenaria]
MMDKDDTDPDSDMNSVAAGGSSTEQKPYQVPCFEISSWSPRGTAGLQFVSLVPFMQTHLVGDKESRAGKIKVSTTHRKQRLKEFQTGRTTCRNIVDERRLRAACNDNDYITVVELLEGGADPSCEDEKKRTPLHIAASQGYQEIAACTCQIPVVTLLLKAGTDIKSVDDYGRTPLKLARSRLQKLVGENKACDSLRAEIKQVSDMMTTYLRISGQNEDADQLESLCRQLEKTTTREEVDHVNSLMAEFASLNIQKTDS